MICWGSFFLGMAATVVLVFVLGPVLAFFYFLKYGPHGF